MINRKSNPRRMRKPAGALWMRRARFFQPIALILAIMMLPADWLPQRLGMTAQAATFTVQPGCAFLGGNSIIQQVCGPSATSVPNSAIIGAVQQWEQDSVTQFLQLNQLPSSAADVAFVYQNARADLRAAIRAFMEVRMWSMATEDPSQLSGNEATVLSWFQSRWTYHERNLYNHAIADYNSWLKNHCTWKPDPDVAKVLKLNYIACVGSILTKNAPNTDYYLLAARKSEYESLLANLPPLAGSQVVGSSQGTTAARAVSPAGRFTRPESTTAGTQANTPGPSVSGFTLDNVSSQLFDAEIGSASVAAGLLIGIPSLVFSVPAFKNSIFPSTRGRNIIRANYRTTVEKVQADARQVAKDAAAEGDEELATDSTKLSSNVEAEFTAESEVEAETTLEAGADGAAETFGISMIVAVIALAITVAVTFAVDEANAIDVVNSQLQLASGQAFPGGFVDMAALLSTKEGLYKYGVVWTEATYPDVPSTTTLPSPSTSVKFLHTGKEQLQQVSGATYKDWSGNTWNMGYYNGYFLNNGAKNVTVNSQTTPITYDSINPLIRFLDWNNQKYTATLFGTNFIVTKLTPASTDTACEPDPSTGISSTTNISTCTAQVVTELQLLDGGGNPVTVRIGTAPVLNFPSGVTLSSSADSLVAVPATGLPFPAVTGDTSVISLDGFKLATPPAGISFTPGYGTGTLHCCLNGSTSTLVPGTYSMNVTATNIVGTTTGSFQFNVGDPSQPLSISQVSGPSGNVYFGQSQKWVWKASGPGQHYTFYTNVSIPGMTFLDNGNGTAQFIGTPTIGTKVCSSLNYCGVWVTNALDHAETPDSNHTFTPFLPNYLYAPAATLSQNMITFPIGKTTSFVIGANAITPVSFSTPCSGLPNWFSVTDNGNGTATVTGSPGQGSATSLPFVIFPTALGSQPVSNPCATPNFTAGVDKTLNVLSAASTTFQSGYQGSFTIQSNGYGGGAVVLDSPLPAGLQFVQNNAAAQGTISGKPNTGTGGTYLIRYHLTPGTGQYGGNYSPAPLVLTINEYPNMLSLPASTYMMAGVPQTFVVRPGGFPTLGDMKVTLDGGFPSVPPGLIGSGESEATTSLGTYTLSGTVPASAAGNSYLLQFGASNSLANTSGSTNVTIVPPGDVNHDMVTNCTDYSIVKSLLNVTYTSSRYNAAADINGDGVINVLDLAFVSSGLPKGTVCH